MKDQLQEILDSLDEKTPRSRLAPYRDFIAKLRRRKYTYREIRRILREKCQVQVSMLKQRTAQPESEAKRFEYDPDQPLQNIKSNKVCFRLTAK